MSAYYSEWEPYAAQWLRNLISAGLIPPGDVDERSITEVQPEDVRGYTQCHWFAGLGGWPYALRLAGWADTRPIWTGSCPCQPFSVAGKGAGKNDSRHLWPHLFRLTAAVWPALLIGEQVAGTAGEDWFDGVAADLGGAGYATRAVDIPACAVDAPHIRQRLYWCAVGDVAHTDSSKWRAKPKKRRHDDDGENAGWEETTSRHQLGCQSDGFWSDAEWLTGADGKARRVKSGVRLLVDGVPARAPKLRALGNAIVAPLAAEFIKAVMECQP